MANKDILTILEQRLGRRPARQRLGIEKDHEAQVFGQGINFFHIENLRLSHAVIRAILVATGLYWRGVSNAAKVEIKHNPILLPDLPASFDGFTILHGTRFVLVDDAARIRGLFDSKDVNDMRELRKATEALVHGHTSIEPDLVASH